MIKRFFPFLALALLCVLLTACAAQDDMLPPVRPSQGGDDDVSPNPSQGEEPMVPDEDDVQSAMDSIDPLPETGAGGVSEAAPAPEVSEPAPSQAPDVLTESVPPSEQPVPPAQVSPPSDAQPFAAAGDLPASRIQAAQIEQQLLQLINNERQQNGVETLGLESAMQFAAQIRAEEALASLSHTRPDGTAYHSAFDESGFSYAGKWHGENLATLKMSVGLYDEAAVAKALFQEWVSSPGHYQNMMGPQFQQTGIGVHVEQDGEMLSVGAAQLFASM